MGGPLPRPPGQPPPPMPSQRPMVDADVADRWQTVLWLVCGALAPRRWLAPTPMPPPVWSTRYFLREARRGSGRRENRIFRAPHPGGARHHVPRRPGRRTARPSKRPRAVVSHAPTGCGCGAVAVGVVTPSCWQSRGPLSAADHRSRGHAEPSCIELFVHELLVRSLRTTITWQTSEAQSLRVRGSRAVWRPAVR